MKKLAFLGLGLALVGSAPAVTITFEELGTQSGLFNNENPLRTEYLGSGVNFFGPGVDDGGAILNESGNFGVNALSGDHFLAFNRSTTGVTMQNGGRPFDPEELVFSSTMNFVSINASGGDFAGTFAISAYDAGGNHLGTNIINTAVGQWGLLSIAVPNISSVTLVELSNATYFVYDDLNAVPEPATLAALGLGAAALLRRRAKRA